MVRNEKSGVAFGLGATSKLPPCRGLHDPGGLQAKAESAH